MIVVDTNVLLNLFCESPLSRYAHLVRAKDGDWIVPPLWRYEFMNGLAKAMWKGFLAESIAIEIMSNAIECLAAKEIEPSQDAVLSLSGKFRITAYDATYVALARQLGVLLVTEDGELNDKFPEVAYFMARFTGKQSPGMVRESTPVYGRKTIKK